MKMCFNDSEIKRVKGQGCNTCSLRFDSNPCRWIGVCGNDSSLNFESLSEVFKL